MPGAVLGNVTFAVRMVMADSAEVAEEFSGGDGPFFLREFRAVFLHRGIEVQFAALPELQNSGGGDGFGDGAQAEER